MKIELFISLILLSSFVCGQIKMSKVDSTKLPKAVKYLGHITNVAKWTDSFGIHYVLTTEKRKYYSKDKENKEVKSAEIFAYHYIINGDSVKLIWKIYDFNKDCEFDVFTIVLQQSFQGDRPRQKWDC